MEESKIIPIIRSFFFSRTRMTFKLEIETLFEMVLQRMSDISKEAISKEELETSFFKAVNQMSRNREIDIVKENEKIVLRPLSSAI